MALATRAIDGRRWQWNRNPASQPHLLQREPENCPNPRYGLDELVLTPVGMKRVNDMYYSERRCTWVYRFLGNGYVHFTEKQLLSQGDGLLLLDVMITIRAGG